MAEQRSMPLLEGTLDMLILRTLIFGPRHGHGIAVTIQRTSEEDLLVDHGSLYPALQRLEPGLDQVEMGHLRSETRGAFFTSSRRGDRKSSARKPANGSGWCVRSDG